MRCKKLTSAYRTSLMGQLLCRVGESIQDESILVVEFYLVVDCWGIETGVVINQINSQLKLDKTVVFCESI